MDEAKRLRDTGMGYVDISKSIMERHPEVKLSFMAVKRALEVVEKNKIDEQIQEGLNPVDLFTNEFREEIRKNTKEVREVIKECKEMLIDAKKNGEITDRVKAADILIKGLANERKNWESLQQFGIMKIDTLNKKAFEQTEQVNILLMNWTNVLESKLCEKCKKEIIPEVIRLVKSEKEGKGKWQMEQ